MTEIPRTIHRLWLGGEEPAWTQPFAETWCRGDWQVLQWDEESIAGLFPLQNQAVYDAAPVLAPDHVGQLRSDVLRYEILRDFGGVWVDADFECLRPIDELIEGLDAFAAWELEPVWVNNAILGAAPGHPFLSELVDRLESNVERNIGYKPNVMTGPWFVTETWKELGEPIAVLPEKRFYPFRWDEVEQYRPGEVDPQEEWPQACAVHWWRNKRREKGLLPS